MSNHIHSFWAVNERPWESDQFCNNKSLEFIKSQLKTHHTPVHPQLAVYNIHLLQTMRNFDKHSRSLVLTWIYNLCLPHSHMMHKCWNPPLLMCQHLPQLHSVGGSWYYGIMSKSSQCRTPKPSNHMNAISLSQESNGIYQTTTLQY